MNQLLVSKPTFVTPTTELCFHCGQSVPKGLEASVNIAGVLRPMCCYGCQAVAQTIIDAGQAAFYSRRKAYAFGSDATRNSRQQPAQDFLSELQAYDNPDLQTDFVTTKDQLRQASLLIEGISCAACVWLLEKHLKAQAGVTRVSLNYSSHRAEVCFDPAIIKLSKILNCIRQIGYQASPYDPQKLQQSLERERNHMLRRIGIAGLFGMQIMMLAVGLYAGEFYGMENSIRDFLRWISLLLCIPVIVWAARPFFHNAWRDLSAMTLGMDTPVAIAILGAFIGSLWHTLSGQGQVYYESIAMFTFLLLCARFFELRTRINALQSSARLAGSPIKIARKLNARNQEKIVPATDLKHGDKLRVLPGEIIPVDAIIKQGSGHIDESLLSGETKALAKYPGDMVFGGSLNVDQVLTLCAENTQANSTLAKITRLTQDAAISKPPAVVFADRIARYFITFVLSASFGVAAYWWLAGNPDWFVITLSVLVATCPCALSLATPSVLTAANGALAHSGLISIKPHAMETLNQITHVVFDKTGTLTEGNLSLQAVHFFNAYTETQALALAAAIAQNSAHPVAKAILDAFTVDEMIATSVEHRTGHGLQATIDGNLYRLGRLDYVTELLDPNAKTEMVHGCSTFLANKDGLIAAFSFADKQRTNIAALLKILSDRKLKTSLLSGDNDAVVQQFTQKFSFDQVLSECSPQQKLNELKKLQAQGAVVLMIGDGVNDGPILAGADLSIAMGQGTDLAKYNADLILFNTELSSIGVALKIANRSSRIIRQNLLWAFGYNCAILPIAAMGMLAPWMAALGMALSSMLVVSNARRAGFSD